MDGGGCGDWVGDCYRVFRSVVATMSWIIEILVRTRRMRGLDEQQLMDLIRNANDVESLRLIKEHLANGSFKYPHLQVQSKELIELCIDKAKEIHWLQHVDEIKKAFMANLGDFI